MGGPLWVGKNHNIPIDEWAMGGSKRILGVDFASTSVGEHGESHGTATL